MRTIKFRAWDKERKVMLHGFPRACLPLSRTEGGYSVGDIDDFHGKLLLMQFTGLLDKNGKEIYEGDIIRRDDDRKSVVKWDSDGYFSLSGRNVSIGTYGLVGFGELAVIGNIYSNPELLEAQNG